VKRLASRLAVLPAVGLLAACAGQTPGAHVATGAGDVAVLVGSESAGSMEAKLEGELIDENGCLQLAIDGEDGAIVLIWPSRTQPLTDASGVTVSGSDLAVGDRVDLTGGFITDPDPETDGIPAIPEGCEGEVFLIGSARPAS
jgi:hypothetical protein